MLKLRANFLNQPKENVAGAV